MKSTISIYWASTSSLIGETIGFEDNAYLQDYLGFIGTLLLLIFVMIIYLVLRLNLTPELVSSYFKKTKKEVQEDFQEAKKQDLPEQKIETEETPTTTSTEEEKTSSAEKELKVETEEKIEEKPKKEKIIITSTEKEDDVSMEVETVEEEELDEDDLKAQKIVEDFGEFDPKLELSNYKFPSLELLKDYTAGGGITINQEELEENKNNIVNTLKNYKIGIAQIKATVGPTVTLYEIVPEAGIRISKIRNLEDDIALSLAALGIRIIAPIPGKGTIGIEVPNKKPSIVSMRSVMASPKFKKAEMQLPIAMGKTISNETFVFDLARMPHLLMAGATGQGKSVGLNAILTSLLYQKHPAELKFVLVDPKKVELTLYNKIERHY